MSTIVYQTNPKTGTKYAYQSESYRDPVTKKPRTRRTYLGIVDPITGEIITKAVQGKRNRSSKIISVSGSSNNIETKELLSQIDKLRTENFYLMQTIKKIKVLLDQCSV